MKSIGWLMNEWISQSINLPIDQSVNQLPGNELRGYSVGEQLNATLHGSQSMTVQVAKEDLTRNPAF